MIRFKCPACDAAVKVEPRLGGTTQECPGCGQGIQIPAARQPVEEKPAPDVTGDFDPMDVLGESPQAPPVAPVTSSSIEEPRESTEPTEEASQSVSEDNTASAATDVVNQIRSPTVPRLPKTNAEVSQEPKQTIGEEIREAFSSSESFFEVIGQRKLYVTLLASMLLALVAFMPRGCSDRIPVYPVSGRVVFSDGSPVKTGTVEFESEEHGKSSTGRIDDNGHFVLGTFEPADGAPAGSHKAIVTQKVISDGTIKHEKDHGLPVSYKYRRFETSGLTFQVKAEENEIRIVVEPEVEAENFNDSGEGSGVE